MSGQPVVDDPGDVLLALYDQALPQVYGYLLSRCGWVWLAEDLTSQTFLAAVDVIRAEPGLRVGVGWVLGVARRKLADHWRRQARERRSLRVVAEMDSMVEDPWNARIDAIRARGVLERLGPHHRAALTLRYLDDLPVPRVAALLGRSTRATEALFVRARAAFRHLYTAEGSDG